MQAEEEQKITQQKQQQLFSSIGKENSSFLYFVVYCLKIEYCIWSTLLKIRYNWFYPDKLHCHFMLGLNKCSWYGQ